MKTYTAYRTTVDLSEDELVIRRVGVLAKAVGAEVRVPLDALVGTRLKEATPLVNGHLQIVLADDPSPPPPAPADPYTVVFRRKTRDEMFELHDTLNARIADKRAAGVDPAAVPVTRATGRLQDAAAKAAAKNEAHKAAAPERFAGITVSNGQLDSPQGGGPLAGAQASVDTAGQLSKRITATRLILTGPLALAWRKKQDHRELYLLVEGDGWGVSVPVDADKGPQARAFAAKVNAIASRGVSGKAEEASQGETTTDPIAQIAKLGELHEQGVLTDEEFEAKKRELLGRL